MIIYGWRRDPAKVLGELSETAFCPQCGARRRWELAAARTWYTLFWIKVIPTGSQYFLTCSACGITLRLRSAGANVARGLLPPATPGFKDPGAVSYTLPASGIAREDGVLNWDLILLPGASMSTRLLAAALVGLVAAGLLAVLLGWAFGLLPSSLRPIGPWVTFFGMLGALALGGWVGFWLTGRAERDLRRRLSAR